MQACPLKKALDKHNQLSLIRKREVIGKRHDAIVSMHGKNIINFTSNDYLNLASHPDVKKAFIQGVECYGLGSGSASFVSGYSRAHQQLEEAFCEFLNRDRAILFNSGYHANLGVLTALSRSHAVIIADKLCHASIIDGILLSRAKHYRYRHRDLNHAKYLVNLHKNSLLVTESVFSMEGDHRFTHS
jgi:8-amino-7-oxononanoate synthase